MSEKLPSVIESLDILRKSGCSPEVIKHCRAVANLAVFLAAGCAGNGVQLDMKLIRIGALLHDIGRSVTHKVDHAFIGADIARKLGLSTQIVSIIERHVGGGITAREAEEMGWPRKDYLPRTIEEKIVSYADKLIEGAKVVSIDKTLQELREKLGPKHPAVKRVEDLHREISNLC